jgi:hypothetical protein
LATKKAGCRTQPGSRKKTQLEEKVEEQKVEKNVAEENLTKPTVEVDPNAKL